MPRVQMDKRKPERQEWWRQGWGCNCPAWRRDTTEDQAYKALMRSSGVEAELRHMHRRELKFRAWSTKTPENRYDVSLMYGRPGGFCKHCAAAAAVLFPWLRQAATTVARREAEWREKEKDLRRLKRQSKKWSKG
jgi:hypothetical protein